MSVTEAGTGSCRVLMRVKAGQIERGWVLVITIEALMRAGFSCESVRESRRGRWLESAVQELVTWKC